MTVAGSSSPELKVDGILIVDKPQDWTSHDVCAFARKRFRFSKVGHAGTLDPMATGVLVLLLGKATKQSNQLTACDKDYFGIMQLGLQTDSHDRTGQVTAEAAWDPIDIEMVRSKALAFTGEIIQIPPMVSALKHQGVRLYKLARQGKTVPREGRPVMVHEFAVEKKEGAFVHFRTKVSKGTYVRTLIHDLGESLGCHATLSELRRTRCGQFGLEESVTVEMLRTSSFDEIRHKIIPLRYFPNHDYSFRSPSVSS